MVKECSLLMAVNGGLWVEADNTFFSAEMCEWNDDDKYKNSQHCENKA